jgi:hypothetical protein
MRRDKLVKQFKQIILPKIVITAYKTTKIDKDLQ